MKKLLTVIAISSLALTACNSAKNSASAGYDDVYGSGRQVVQNNVPAAPQNNVQNYSTSPVPQSNNRFDYANPSAPDANSGGNTYITNNNYNADNYYDYAYSSRIRRFYNPVGLGYYNPYFTNSYWYDYQPASWGMSIYSTYNWWAPSIYYSYNPFIGSGWGFNIGFGNPYWYRPYYYPGGFYNPYMYNSFGGCNSCCFGCYQNFAYNNNCPYYYNSYDNTSHYFGNSKGNHVGGSGVGYVQSGRGAILQSNSLGAVYANNNPVTNTINTTPNTTGSTTPIRNNNLNATQQGKNNAGDINTSGDVRNNTTNTNTTGGVKPVRNNPAYTPANQNAPLAEPNIGDIKPANGDARGNPVTNPRNNSNVIMYTPDPRNNVNTTPNVNSNPRNNNTPANSEYSNPRNNSIPLNSDYSNPRNNNMPSNNDYSNPRNNNMPSKNDYSNPRGDYKNNENNSPRQHATPSYQAPKDVVKPSRDNSYDKGNSTPRSNYQSPSNDKPSYSAPKQSAPRQSTPSRNPR
jgi:hypothetical protein